MKIYVVFYLAAFVAGAFATAGQRVPFGPLSITNPSLFSSSAAVTVMCGARRGRTCLDDCSTQITCTSSGAPVLQQTCASINAATPFCVRNSCSSTPDATNKQCGSKFTCTSDGAFPDPIDSTSYHVCSSSDAVSEQYVCGAGLVYNSREVTCDPGTPIVTPLIDCKTNPLNSMIVFPPNAAYYALCTNTNGLLETIMFRCPDVQSQTFNVATFECSYACTVAGNFVDRENCNGYISCVQSGTNFIATRKNCPARFGFNSTTKRCEFQATACVSEIGGTTTPDPDC